MVPIAAVAAALLASTIKQHAEDMKEHRSAAPVLVGVDGSPSSMAAVELGAWEAKRRRVELQLVHGYSGDLPYVGYGLATVGALTHSPREDARAMVRDVELKTRSTHPGLRVHGTIVGGGGASGLVELSRDASLGVVGSRGHGGFADRLVGSVAAQVAMHAHAPGVVVRPPLVDSAGAREAVRLYPTAGPVIVGVDGSTGGELALQFAADEAAARQQPLVVAYVWWADAAEVVRPDRGRDHRLCDARVPRHPVPAVPVLVAAEFRHKALRDP